jgi:hypothetical protein
MSIINEFYKYNISSFELPKLSEQNIIEKINNDLEKINDKLVHLLHGYPVDNFSIINYHITEGDEIVLTKIKTWRYQCKLPDYIVVTDELRSKINEIALALNATASIKIAYIGSNLWKNIRSAFFTNKNIILIEIIENVPKDYVDNWILKNGKLFASDYNKSFN